MTDWLFHQQYRFLRPDGGRYLRPDRVRYLVPEQKWKGQPRIEEGADAGRFTYGTMDGSDESSSGRPRVYITGEDGVGPDTGVGEEDDDEWWERQLAGDLPEGLGGPDEGAPKVPEERPTKGSQRNSILRLIANFLGRNSGPAVDIFLAALDGIEWLERYEDHIRAAKDPPKSLRELQAHVGKGRPGYDDHHIVEKTPAQRWGLSKNDIDDASNVVSIPRLKHYQITGWFQKANPDFGGLSPRQYLSDKGVAERRAVGLYALELYKVLKR